MSAAHGRLHQRAAGRLSGLLGDACPEGFEVLMGRDEDFTATALPFPVTVVPSALVR